jgi:membrane-bound ClpP family serine protease
MAEPNKFSRAGGALLALSIVAGALIGLFAHQPSIGFLAGTGIGLLLLGLIWLLDRRRS